MAFVTYSNRPQPLWRPPPTACLSTSGAASEAPSLLMHPCPPPPPQKALWAEEQCRPAGSPMRETESLLPLASVTGTCAQQRALALKLGGEGSPGGLVLGGGGCPPQGWQQGRDQPTAHGTVHVVRRCETLVRGVGGWDRRGCATGAPRGANRQGGEQHRHTERGGHTRRDKGEHSKQGGGAQQGRRGN